MATKGKWNLGSRGWELLPPTAPRPPPAPPSVEAPSDVSAEHQDAFSENSETDAIPALQVTRPRDPAFVNPVQGPLLQKSGVPRRGTQFKLASGPTSERRTLPPLGRLPVIWRLRAVSALADHLKNRLLLYADCKRLAEILFDQGVTTPDKFDELDIEELDKIVGQLTIDERAGLLHISARQAANDDDIELVLSLATRKLLDGVSLYRKDKATISSHLQERGFTENTADAIAVYLYGQGWNSYGIKSDAWLTDSVSIALFGAEEEQETLEDMRRGGLSEGDILEVRQYRQRMAEGALAAGDHTAMREFDLTVSSEDSTLLAGQRKCVVSANSMEMLDAAVQEDLGLSVAVNVLVFDKDFNMWVAPMGEYGGRGAGASSVVFVMNTGLDDVPSKGNVRIARAWAAEQDGGGTGSVATKRRSKRRKSKRRKSKRRTTKRRTTKRRKSKRRRSTKRRRSKRR